MNNSFESIGFVSAVMTSLAFYPQAIATMRDGDVSGLSLISHATYATGLILLAVYGFLMGLRPTILSALISLPPALYLVYRIADRNKQLRAMAFPEERDAYFAARGMKNTGKMKTPKMRKAKKK